MYFEDYLNGRNQKVLINGKSSSQKPVSAGVPQGPVLSPLLFLIYINDISDELTGLARLFADDTTLSYSSADKHYYNLKQTLQKLSKWAKNGLLFSIPPKTEVMLISNVFNDNNFELVMDGTILKIVETHKHLGVHLSSNNKW